MKLVVNQGVRDTMQELDKLFEQHDQLTRTLSDYSLDHVTASNSGHDKIMLEKSIVNMSARLISHATKGHRYPNMTEYRRDQWRW